MTSIKTLFLPVILILGLHSCAGQTPATSENAPDYDRQIFESIDPPVFAPIEKDDDYWKDNLDKQAWYVLRQAGTERAFTGKYDQFDEEGIFCCAGCGLPLFSSEHKYDSRTGWPSYYKPIAAGVVKYVEDRSHGMIRVEVVCARCDGHQGHIFEDGPEPTGLRYCINSASLQFVPRKRAAEVKKEFGL